MCLSLRQGRSCFCFNVKSHAVRLDFDRDRGLSRGWLPWRCYRRTPRERPGRGRRGQPVLRITAPVILKDTGSLKDEPAAVLRWVFRQVALALALETVFDVVVAAASLFELTCLPACDGIR
jgi:hypothetical protein